MKNKLKKIFPNHEFYGDFTDKADMFCALLKKWNAKINLTSVNNDTEIFLKHICDSIAGIRVLPEIRGEIGDFGSGAGLPGIILALLYPETHIFSFDSVGKKIEFQLFCRRQLKIENFHPVKMNLNNPDEGFLNRFDAVVTRAFADTLTVLSCAYPLLVNSSPVYLWKSATQIEPPLHDSNFYLKNVYHYEFEHERSPFSGRIAEYTANKK